MKNWFFAAAVVVASALAVAPSISDAKRFGGGSSSGMQRSMPSAAPNKPAAPQQAGAPAAGGAPAAAASRSWMGPIAGLAAGLGIAALMSHLGMGEAFGNFLMLALLAVAAVFLVRFLMRRFAAGNAATGIGAQRGQLATASATPAAPAWAQPAAAAQAPVLQRTQDSGLADAQLSADGSSRLASLSGAPANLPADFDAEGFSRIAKMIFIRMQAANDAGDLNDLRTFTTPEMFAVAKLELQDRGDKQQTTDVVKVDAEVLDLNKEGERQVVSVRYHGRIREEAGGPEQDFDEIWHLVRFGDSPSWAISGIQQRH